ncbi:NRDE family protein [Gillisia sp. Hel_I_29]|uniref:NRDE family protein n=1 Tax=Gillisia sp. Hel_I_29 TaxID=1249975 RepID=UPI0005537159|nr:NRDE family protein [Gillisia sp. Hel_I_29]
MCTVTLSRNFLKNNDFVLTSNRDEAAGRSTFIPMKYTEDNVTILYPKDAEAGGTWIGLSDNCRVICLLNGEFKSHIRKDKYRISRGVVVKDFLKAKNLVELLNNYDLENIEPFTLIAGDWNMDLKFIELVWDGERKHVREIKEELIIWSSSPLYSEEMKSERISWLKDFSVNNEIDANSLWKFHHAAGNGDKNTDVIMDRGFVKTKSITQIIKQSNAIEMIYEDLEITKLVRTKF